MVPAGEDAGHYVIIWHCVMWYQLEKMQAENAQEWAMREKLSSEKLALERENRRMRSEIVRLEDELRDCSRPPVAVGDIDTKTLQDELACKTKVLYFVHTYLSFIYDFFVYSWGHFAFSSMCFDETVCVFDGRHL